jgi:hypothetical protein
MSWWYHDANSRRVFQHYRYPRTPTENDPRDKAYGYRYLVGDNDWVDGKPPGADGLIYRLPLVLANRDARLIGAEGERDADSALGLGALATCHHGGGGHFTEAMAESLAGHRGQIVLVADNDVIGALDVCRRFDLLRAVGIPAKRLRVCEVALTHRGADLRDHLEAGYGLDELRRADLDALREIAATATGHPSEGSWGGTAEERNQLATWRPVTIRQNRAPIMRRTRVIGR